MHPTIFIDNVRLLDRSVRNISADENILKKLKSVHPRNFLSTDILFQIAEIQVSYDTHKGNRKTAVKYAIQPINLYSNDDIDMQAKIQAEANINKYNTIHRDSELRNFSVENAKVICMAVLRIE